MAQLKAQNDPWTPLPEKTEGILHPPPCDPRYQLIDSDRYIESLEKRLKRLKGRNKPEPSSRDIIDSLAGFKNDQMRRFLQNGHSTTPPSSSSSPSSFSFIITEDTTTSSSTPTSYLQRKLRPERQALYTEELFELLKDDELARNRVEEEEGDEEQTQASQTDSAKVTEVCREDGKKNPETDAGKERNCGEAMRESVSESVSESVNESVSVSEKSAGEQDNKHGGSKSDADTSDSKQSEDVNEEQA